MLNAYLYELLGLDPDDPEVREAERQLAEPGNDEEAPTPRP